MRNLFDVLNHYCRKTIGKYQFFEIGHLAVVDVNKDVNTFMVRLVDPGSMEVFTRYLTMLNNNVSGSFHSFLQWLQLSSH